MASLHCNRCEVDWPVDYDDFSECPQCCSHTWWMCAGQPMDREKALSIKRHEDFDRFYEKREKSLAALVDDALDGVEAA